MKYFPLLTLLLPISLNAQPNCNAYLYQADTLQYEACKIAEEVTNSYYQFSKEYQEGMDEALQICPYFAYAYREKAAAYVKSGDFLTWKNLIDKAVKYDPIGYLGVRASLRYKFFGDYLGAINDIDSLERLISYDIGATSNGTYHLNIVKGICYKELGNKEKAIELIQSQIDTESYIGAFDFLHLGVLHLEMKNYDNAIEAFRKQSIQNDLAENHFYLALLYKEIGEFEKCIDELEKAQSQYLEGYKMHDPYNALIDEIDLQDIVEELNTAYNK